MAWSVVSHDPALNPNLTRDASGAWLDEAGPLIRAMRAVELASYDVGRLRPGTAYSALFPEQSPCEGEHIPMLAHVLLVDNDVNFVIELKTFPDRPGVAAQRAGVGRGNCGCGGCRRCDHAHHR